MSTRWEALEWERERLEARVERLERIVRRMVELVRERSPSLSDDELLREATREVGEP